MLVLEDDLTQRIVSSDPIHCPITGFYLHDVRDSTNTSITDFAGITLSTTGLLTVLDYTRLPEGIYYVLITAGTGFSYFTDFNFKVVS